jgi:hypothetical protein
MHTNDSTWMQPVLDVIKAADPDLFGKIDAADWTVTVVDEPDDLDYLLPKLDFGSYMSILSSLARANGVTVLNTPQAPAALRGRTWLNRSFISEEARSIKVPPFKFAAYTVVHEFTHWAGADTEAPAYAAGREFALKMSEPSIAKRSDQTLETVQKAAAHNR